MKIEEAKAVMEETKSTEEIMKKIERCGRVCYQSESVEGSADKFVKMLIKRGHESVLEHESITFHIICDRGVLAELTRHRIASFSVESTRYVKYKELTCIRPVYWKGVTSAREMTIWEKAMVRAERYYTNLLNRGVPPEQARAVLPNSLKTEMYMTANLREWRTIIKLRCDKRAHPQMRELMNQVLEQLWQKLPVVFEDLKEKYLLEG